MYFISAPVQPGLPQGIQGTEQLPSIETKRIPIVFICICLHVCPGSLFLQHHHHHGDQRRHHWDHHHHHHHQDSEVEDFRFVWSLNDSVGLWGVIRNQQIFLAGRPSSVLPPRRSLRGSCLQAKSEYTPPLSTPTMMVCITTTAAHYKIKWTSLYHL